MIKIDFNKNVSRIYNVLYPNENRQLINSEFEDDGISEMRSYMNDVISKMRPNYPLGMIKLFKRKPNYMPGGKHYTYRASSAFSASGDDDGSVNRCNRSGANYNSYNKTYQVRHERTNTYYGCDNYCMTAYKNIDSYGFNNEGSKDYYVKHSHGDDNNYNIIGGGNLICYEYVGGDYGYDDENKIQYGMPDPSYCLETNKWRV